MSKFEQRESGLIVPSPSAPKDRPVKKVSILEVDSQERREKVSKAMLQLWDALDLSGFRKLDNPIDAQNHDDHHRLYKFIGGTLLGDDCPFREELC